MPAPEPSAAPQPESELLLTELARLVHLVAASPDREIGEIVRWLHARGL